MSGNFELIDDKQGGMRVALVSGDGEVLASSGPFLDMQAAITGIALVREVAGTGHIVDRTSSTALASTG